MALVQKSAFAGCEGCVFRGGAGESSIGWCAAFARDGKVSVILMSPEGLSKAIRSSAACGDDAVAEVYGCVGKCETGSPCPLTGRESRLPYSDEVGAMLELARRIMGAVMDTPVMVTNAHSSHLSRVVPYGDVPTGEL